MAVPDDSGFEDTFLYAMSAMKEFHDYAEAYERQVETMDEYDGLLESVIDDLNASWRQAETAKSDLDAMIAEQDLEIDHGSHRSEIDSVEAFLHRAPQDELRSYVQESDDETDTLETLLANTKNLGVYNKTYLQALSTIYENEPAVRASDSVNSPQQRRKERDDEYTPIQEQIEEEIEKIRGAKDEFTHYEL